jgi:hypothetical protein
VLALLLWASTALSLLSAHEIPHAWCNDDINACADTNTEEVNVTMLQLKHKLAGQSPQVDSSLSGFLPIQWVHVRKSGTSFLLTLLRINGFCQDLPEEIPAHALNEMVDFPPEWNCNESFLDRRRLWHHGIDFRPPGGFDSAKGRFMMFVRQPEQRILSEYYFAMEYHKNQSLEGIIAVRRSCLTQTLSSNVPGDFLTNVDPGQCLRTVSDEFLSAQLGEAKLRLQTGFSFVGLTERWDLSICLFNRMFKQKCHSSEFDNTRVTKGKTSSTYDTTVLNGWRDVYDNELYDVAVEIFEAKLKMHNISESSCEPCWREAGLL